jgi:hypothetical protein
MTAPRKAIRKSDPDPEPFRLPFAITLKQLLRETAYCVAIEGKRHDDSLN